jgi:hypothetical protein
MAVFLLTLGSNWVGGTLHSQTNEPVKTQGSSSGEETGDLLDLHFKSKDRMFGGEISIPANWKMVSLRFTNTTTGQILGTYNNVLENLTATMPTFKIYSHKSDMFSDQDVEDAKHDPAVVEQKVVFYKDDNDPRLLHFSSIFDAVGTIQIQVIQYGKQIAYGQTKLTADADFSSLINATDKAISGQPPPPVHLKDH